MRDSFLRLVQGFVGVAVLAGCSSNQPAPPEPEPFVVDKVQERCFKAMRTPTSVAGSALSGDGTVFYFARDCSQNFYGMHEVHAKAPQEEVDEGGLGYKSGSPGARHYADGEGVPVQVEPQIERVNFNEKSTDWMKDNLEFYRELAEKDPTPENLAAYDELRVLYGERVRMMEEAERLKRESEKPRYCDDVTDQLGIDCIEEEIIMRS